jgi:hypothetical protein
MRSPLSRFLNPSGHAVRENPELSEVLRALAGVTREEKMRSHLVALAEEEEAGRPLSGPNPRH